MRLGLGLSLSNVRGGASVPEPALTSLNYSIVDNAGGDSVTITGTDLTDASACTVGGTSATITANTETSLTFTVPAKAAGTYDVVVTTAGGDSNALSLEYFDLDAQSFSGWFNPSYSTLPHSGTASAGNSGLRTLSEATNPPSTTTAVNGYTPFRFDGSNDRLIASGTNSNYVTAGAGTFFAILRPITSAADNATVYLNKPIWVDTTQALMGAGFSNAGFRPYIYDGGYKDLNTLPMSIGDWHWVAQTWNGTTLFGMVDSTTDSKAAGNAQVSGFAIHIGTSYNGGVFANMDVLVLGWSTTAISSANLAKIRDCYLCRFAL